MSKYQRHGGGKAFPHIAKHWDSDSGGYVESVDHHEAGITMRDYFATAALQALMADYHKSSKSIESFAEIAYAAADAMLDTRGEVAGE